MLGVEDSGGAGSDDTKGWVRMANIHVVGEDGRDLRRGGGAHRVAIVVGPYVRRGWSGRGRGRDRRRSRSDVLAEKLIEEDAVEKLTEPQRGSLAAVSIVDADEKPRKGITLVDNDLVLHGRAMGGVGVMVVAD